MLTLVKIKVDRTGYDWWIYDGFGYTARSIEITKVGNVYTASHYISTESGYGDTDPEYITEDEDFYKVIEVLLAEGFFDVERGHDHDISRDSAENFLKEREEE